LASSIKIERSKRQERPNCFEFNINCDSPMFLARSYKDLHISSSERLWPVETRCASRQGHRFHHANQFCRRC
jgi:hypothetical protein